MSESTVHTVPSGSSEDRREELLARVDDLAPRIVDAAAESDWSGHVPRGLLTELESAGLFDMLTPRALGGLEVPLQTALTVYEHLGVLDGSLAWRVWNGNFGFIGAVLGREGRDTLWLGPHRPRFANAGRPGTALRADGGWIVRGRWETVSGADTAEWFVLGALESPASEDGPLRVVLSVDQVAIRSRWSAPGLRASASHAVEVDDEFVPDSLVTPMAAPSHAGPGLFGGPVSLLVVPGVTAVTIGIATAALRAAVESAITSSSRVADPVHRLRTARADAALRAARAGFLDAVGAVTAHQAAGGRPTAPERARLRASMAHAAAVCSDVFDAAGALSGTAGLAPGSLVERTIRDGRTALRHGNQSDSVLVPAGGVLLGDDAAGAAL